MGIPLRRRDRRDRVGGPGDVASRTATHGVPSGGSFAVGMNLQEAIAAIRQGKLVECTAEEYDATIRSGLQDQAGTWIDQGQDPFARIALEEVKRLDLKFDCERMGRGT